MPVSPEVKRGRGVMVLTAVLMVAVLAIGGWFAAYKINTDKTIATQDQRIEKLQRDLKTKTGELGTTKDDLAEAEDDLEAAYECVDAAQDLLNATDQETANKAVRSMLKKC